MPPSKPPMGPRLAPSWLPCSAHICNPRPWLSSGPLRRCSFRILKSDEIKFSEVPFNGALGLWKISHMELRPWLSRVKSQFFPYWLCDLGQAIQLLCASSVIRLLLSSISVMEMCRWNELTATADTWRGHVPGTMLNALSIRLLKHKHMKSLEPCSSSSTVKYWLED